MKIYVFEAEARERLAFQRLGEMHNVTLIEGPLRASEAERYGDAELISPFIYSDLSRSVLQRLPALKFIATRSTGYDHIDIAYCHAHDIPVSNVPSYGENTVAEHVFALLLAISHRLPEAMERAIRGNFSPEGLEGFDLAGKTIGVIGTGGIGRHVVRIAKGFEMEVIAFDIHEDAELARSLGFRYEPLDVLLRFSDIVTLHVPSGPATRHMLSAESFSQMKEGVIIINTARGDLIDTRALISALTSGKVTAAGLDVLPDEPLIREEAELISSAFCDQHDLQNLVANHVLLRMRNVIVTPHSAFNTKEATGRIVKTSVENIAAFLAGTPQNCVTVPGSSGKSAR